VEGQPLPAAALAPGATVDIAGAWPRSVTHADALGRVTFTRDEDGRETATTYGPLWTERRDHEDLHPAPPYQDTPERSEHDGLGRTLARKQLLADRTIVHAYAHDAAGRLAATIDPAGHITTFTRDGAGRLTQIDSPDAGTLRQRFDRTGRVTERIDATGARITWAFDPLGRFLHERSYDPAGAQVGEVRHHYDGSGPFARGQLARVEDDAGSVDFTYDARGRIATSTRTFAAADGPITLTAGQVYDAQDRILRDIFPDGSTLEHDYSPRGLERPLEHFIDAPTTTRSPAGATLTLPSGVDAAPRPRPRRPRARPARHRRLAHAPRPRPPLRRRRPARRDRDDLAAEGFSLTQTFVYDDLRRLVGHTAAGHHADLALQRRRQPARARRPHPRLRRRAPARRHHPRCPGARVRRRGPARRDLRRRPAAAGAWRFDPHGRVQSFTATDGRRVEHIHGYTGERAIRREYDAAGQLAHEVLYFTRNLEIRDGKLVRWVYFAGERIAESPVPLPAGGFPELPAEALTVAPPPPGPAAPARPPPVARSSRWPCACSPCGPAGSRRRRRARARQLGRHPELPHNPDRTLTPDEHTRFHVADRLGSAALVLDHRGRVLTRDAADPYGASRLAWRADEDTAAPTYRFTGKEDDALSGAIAIGARHYLPSSAAGRAPTRTSCSRTRTPPSPRPARPTPTATSAATPSPSPTRPAARASPTAARTAPASSTTSPTARIPASRAAWRPSPRTGPSPSTAAPSSPAWPTASSTPR
jgi:YD repeat-containing protein